MTFSSNALTWFFIVYCVGYNLFLCIYFAWHKRPRTCARRRHNLLREYALLADRLEQANAQPLDACSREGSKPLPLLTASGTG